MTRWLLLVICVGAGCRSSSTRPAAPSAPALEVDRFPEVAALPDPFLREDGTRIRARAEWRAQRESLRARLLRHEYGHAPPAPREVRGVEVAREPIAPPLARVRVRVESGPEPRLTFWLGLVRPAGAGPFPAILHIDHRGPFAASQAAEVARRGYLFVGFDPTFLDPDEPGAVGPAQAAYASADWATLAVWAWGASRAIDYLWGRPDVERGRIVVTGHSRSGKAALLAGALDERVALTAPQCSGTGGAASYRVRGAGAESLAAITGNFPHWFLPSLAAFAGREGRLPFDQHFLLALCAPRPLLVLEALGDRWANTEGTQEALEGARPLYRFLGAADRIGFSFRPGEHDQTDEDWHALLDFADAILLGKPLPPGRRFDRLPAPDRKTAFRWTAP